MLEGKKRLGDAEKHIAYHIYYEPNANNADALALFKFSGNPEQKVLVAFLIKQIKKSTKSAVFDGDQFHS